MIEETAGKKNTDTIMPVLFVGHGSPMNIVQENAYTKSLMAIKSKLPAPRCILVISAHWLTKGTYVTCSENPVQGFDFYGFPKELYEVKYLPKGSPECAKAIINLSDIENRIKCEYSRGLDHGSWAVLKLLYPNADVPVVQMSIDSTKPVSYHYTLAKKLRALRENRVLILCSGNIVHNLRAIDFENVNAEPFSWAVEFDRVVGEMIAGKKHSELMDYKRLTETASMAVPTPEHYLPLIYTLGLQTDSDNIETIYEGFQNKAVSMRSFILL
ncbi:MAG: 4,5-DOPA dioxygenase extradiol [Syntrophothermus sp.]